MGVEGDATIGQWPLHRMRLDGWLAFMAPFDTRVGREPDSFAHERVRIDPIRAVQFWLALHDRAAYGHVHVCVLDGHASHVKQDAGRSCLLGHATIVEAHDDCVQSAQARAPALPCAKQLV